MELQLNESWLDGKYPAVDAEINTAFSTVKIGEYFWQDWRADEVIAVIYSIWMREECTQDEAIRIYMDTYLNN